MMQQTPLLASSCAHAATRAELRYRIDAAVAPRKATRVVALDDAAREVLTRIARLDWANARFLSSGDAAASEDEEGIRLTTLDGETSEFVIELDGADLVVLVATDDTGSDAASTIGAACTVRGIMTAGVVLLDNIEVSPAVNALRPHAGVLLVPADEEDLVELLRAMRA